MSIILRIIFGLLILLGIATILVFVFLLWPDLSPFQEQTFSANVIPVATMFAAWTTLLIAFVAIKAIENSNKLELQRRADDLAKEKRANKERLLDTIIAWAEEVITVSVTPDSLILKKAGRLNELMRYGSCLARAVSMNAIIMGSFQKELYEMFGDVVEALAKFMVIKHYATFHTLPSEESFPKEALDEIQNEINSQKPIPDLYSKYVTEMDMSCKKFLNEANNVKIALLV